MPWVGRRRRVVKHYSALDATVILKQGLLSVPQPPSSLELQLLECFHTHLCTALTGSSLSHMVPCDRQGYLSSSSSATFCLWQKMKRNSYPDSTLLMAGPLATFGPLYKYHLFLWPLYLKVSFPSFYLSHLPFSFIALITVSNYLCLSSYWLSFSYRI